MFMSFLKQARARVSEHAHVAAFVSFLAGLSAALYAASSLLTIAPVQAATALQAVSSTLSQPAFSANWVSNPTKTNVTYAWAQTSAYQTNSGDTCESTGDCYEFVIQLPATGVTSTQQGWSATLASSDVSWSGNIPANTHVSSTVLSDTNSDGIMDKLTVKVNCWSSCTFATSTFYSFDIINYPLINPEQPGGYTSGSYTSISQAVTTKDKSVSLQQDEAKTAIVEIGQGITVTASVSPTMTFSVAGVAASTSFYADTSTQSTTGNADACDFGSLTPGSPKICLFTLNINTNATNGYSIYVVQDQNMTFNGNSIKQFKDGTRVDDSAATYWTSPLAASLAHLGYSSNDTSVFAATSTALWAGIPNIATSGQAPITTGLVADSSAPGSAAYTYALKIESASTLPQGTNYTHHEYFMVVGNF
jgi:hypothetical protein